MRDKFKTVEEYKEYLEFIKANGFFESKTSVHIFKRDKRGENIINK